MKLSVVIPTCNRAHTLARALDSVLAQTLPPAEIIVVDDGSQDATGELLRQRYPQVTVLRQVNSGVSRARNRGVAAARFDWVAFLDSDDSWLPHKLATQARALQSSDSRLCHSDEIWIRHGRRVNPMRKHAKRGGEIFLHCLPRCAISPSTTVLHKTLFDAAGRFDESLPACEDYDLWLRVCSRHPVLYVPEQLAVRYAGHDDQLSKRHWGMDRFRVQALARLLQDSTLRADYRLAALRTVLEKLDVLIAGAQKRNNSAGLQHWRAQRAEHATALEALAATTRVA